MKALDLLTTSACLTLAACGGGVAPTPVIQVAGSYEVTKTLVSDACGGIPQRVSNSATVQHAAGATTFVLTDHGTRDLPGTLQSDGTFQIAPTPAIVHGSIPAVDTFADGRFTTAGFSVRDTTDLEATPTNAACRTVVLWEAAKQGAPNVIP